MLAIAHWTGQIPRRPPLPDGCTVSQLIALGSRRKRSKVYWMLARSEQEVGYVLPSITLLSLPRSPSSLNLTTFHGGLVGWFLCLFPS